MEPGSGEKRGRKNLLEIGEIKEAVKNRLHGRAQRGAGGGR